MLWSLSVEEAFYLVFPLLCLLLLRRGGRWAKPGIFAFVAVLLLFVAVGHLARTVWAGDKEIWQENSYLGGMDSITMGCLTALTVHGLKQRARSLSHALLLCLQIVGAALMLLIGFYPRTPWMAALGRHGLDDNVLAFSACLVMLASVLRNRPGRRWSAPLRWFGRLSYEVYLTHEFGVIGLTLLYEHMRMAGTATGSPVLWIAGMLAVSMPVGYGFARYWSGPMNRRLRAW